MSSNNVGLDSSFKSDYVPTDFEKNLKAYLQKLVDEEITKYINFGCKDVSGMIPKNMSLIRQADGTIYNKIELPSSIDFETVKKFYISEKQEIASEFKKVGENYVFVLLEFLNGKKLEYLVFPFIYNFSRKNKNQLRFWEFCNEKLVSVKFDLDRLK